jgi:MEMO1 family protein
MNTSGIVFSGIVPHPPVMVPEVGGEAAAAVSGSITAMAELTHRVMMSGAETLVLISPHAPLEADAFVAYEGPVVAGDFSSFRAPSAQVEAPVDADLLREVSAAAREDGYEVVLVGNCDMDHGTAVPLYFLQRHGWQGPVLALGYCFLSNEDHIRFGDCIKRAAHRIGRRVAFIASGDLSHRLKPKAPAGFHPAAHCFDDRVLEALLQNAPELIVDLDQELRRQAGECGYRSLLVAIGAASELKPACEVLHYEAPFGVGYLVAQLTNESAAGEAGSVGLATPEGEAEGAGKPDLPGLARSAVETFVTTGQILSAGSQYAGLLGAPAPCFVSLRTAGGELRGCIGTIEPAKANLAEELIANAISAATRDPRFPPVAKSELADLRYSVDVLCPPERVELQELDPAEYGVIVEDESGRRGLLLPAIEGVDTAVRQVEIAARKAGIRHGASLQLSRFRVSRFSEVPRQPRE